MFSAERAEAILNHLNGIHRCGAECAIECVLVGLDPAIPSHRDYIAALSDLDWLAHA